jgi:FMN hydrolase / 5-amino-6-(5-phospho-D-ribitylamino)uracil phosphatase
VAEQCCEALRPPVTYRGTLVVVEGRNEAMIRAISFDADQTLWDFRGVMERALARTAAGIAERYPHLEVTGAELQEIRDAVAVGYRGKPHSLAEIRRESFQVALERGGVEATEAVSVSKVLADRYLTVRFEEIEMYDDVRPMLDALGQRFRLALISNGNTDPDRCGLPGVFDAVVLGPDHGIEKPHPKMFEMAAERLEVTTVEMLHVGDSAVDVIGANGVRAVSVLLDRGEREVDDDVRAGAGFAITSLSELPAVLASLG